MICSTPPGPPSGRPTARVTPVRALLATSGLALMVALGACTSDPVDESGDAGAVPTYADGSTEQTDTSAGSDGGRDSGNSGADGGGDSTVIPAEGEQQADLGDVVVTYWHWNSDAGAVEAAGFVDALVEDGGTCTLTLTRGATVLSGEGSALADANTTSCGLVGVPVPGGNGGDWTAVLAYESPTGQSSSEPFTVTVP